MLDKRALRREIAAQKRALSPAQIEAASADLTAQLLAHPLFRAARSLYAYLSYNQEVRTLPLIRQAQALGKRVAVPKVYGETDMRFLWLDDPARIAPGAYGIPEPVDDGPEADDPAALVLMPGPVSYTHLDVYKRQGQGMRAGPARSGCGRYFPDCLRHGRRRV